jgi:hypothetical protein
MSDTKPVTWHDDPSHFRKVNRREFLYAGLVGGLGLSMGDFFRLQAAETDKYEATAQSLIHIFLPAEAHTRKPGIQSRWLRLNTADRWARWIPRSRV